MKRPLEDSASAPPFISLDTVAPLQNQLLIELLKKNIDATSRASSQDHPIHFEPSSLTNFDGPAESTNSLVTACRDIDRMVSVLHTISQNLNQSIMVKKSIGLNANQVNSFIERIDRLKKDIGSCCFHDEISLFDRAKENVNSLVGFLVKDKKRVDMLNEGYVDRICEMRVQLDDVKGQIRECLNFIDCTKDAIRSLSVQSPAVEDLQGTVLEHVVEVKIDTINQIHEMFELPIDELATFDNVLERINSILWRVVCAVKQQKFKTRKLTSEKTQLSQQLEDTRNLLSSQQKILLEQTRRYEEEIARLQAELESAKARDQTTPPTSATRKRRVLVNTVIAFTGLSRDPERLHELTDTAAKTLQCKVHLSADFTSDITHVVCPPGYQSARTMAAALSSKWIMSAEWLTESAKAGKLLPENSFGQLHIHGPSTLRAKTFYFTPAFIAQQAAHQMNASCCKTLIEPIGKGRVIDDVETSDFVLCGDREERRSKRWIRLKDFIRMIPGHNT